MSEKFFVKIMPVENAPVVLGAKASDILASAFAGYFEEGNAEYIAEIFEDCLLAAPKDIAKLISGMKSARLERVSADGINIYKKDFNPGAHAHAQFECDIVRCNTARNTVAATELLRKKIIDRHLENGVMIYNPESVRIDFGVRIESGVEIHQNNCLRGDTVIKSGCVLNPNNIITDSVIAENVQLTSSTLEQATVGEKTCVGPNAYLRPHSEIGSGCRIGDFVEIKNAKIGNGTKVSHLTYVGDATVGENVNIGCGVVFVNYNGKTKSRSYVGNNCFLGCNCNLIAPLTVGDNCFIAAGTTLTKDLPSNAFCIGRSHEEIKENRASKYLNKLNEHK